MALSTKPGSLSLRYADLTRTSTARHARVATTPRDLINRPGVFMMIPVSALKIDTAYQRPSNPTRIEAMARNWSWVACAALIVALRGKGSGDYYVVEGQHRLEAAKRAAIKELPCLVFEGLTHPEEAQTFLDINVGRRSVGILDRYRALLATNDPTALKAQQLLASAGRAPAEWTGSGVDGQRIRCIDYLMTAIRIDAPVLERIWPLICELCEDRLLSKDILAGMFYTERYLLETSLTDQRWRRRLLQVGYDDVSKSITETRQYEGAAGSAVAARGLLRAINKGMRSRLVLKDDKDAK